MKKILEQMHIIENFTLSNNLVLLSFLFGLGILTTIIFLFPILFKTQIENSKIGIYTSTFLRISFYKLPLRWMGLLWISFLSLFRKNEKIYLKNVFNNRLDNINEIDNEFLTTVCKEPIYAYSLFIINTVSYFQRIRVKENTFPYSGFLGRLKLHTDFYEVDSSSDLIKKVELTRFRLGQWVPKKSEEEFISSWKQNEIEKIHEHMYDSSDVSTIQIRTVASSSKRF